MVWELMVLSGSMTVGVPWGKDGGMQWIVGRRVSAEAPPERVPIEAPSSWDAVEQARAGLAEGGIIQFVMKSPGS